MAHEILGSDHQERYRTAIHEAGHAVLQVALGIGCNGVTIVPSGEFAGMSTDGGEYGCQASELGDDDDDVANLRLFAENEFHMRHAVADYAGMEAVLQWAPNRDDWHSGAAQDQANAANRISHVTSDMELANLLELAARRRCKLLVAHYFPEITAVAEMLRDLGTLSGEMVRKTSFDSLTKRNEKFLTW